MPDAGETHRILTRGWLAWCAFVIYGSLLPFDLRSVPWNQAVAQFAHLPWLNIGLGGRLDWLANVLLYIPVGFVGTCLLWRDPKGRKATSNLHVALGTFAVFVLGSVLAVAVEFTQIYFPPRTVSLNDVVAEVLGTAVGCALALLFGRAFMRLLTRAASNDAPPRLALLQLYLLIYLGLSFFPFDFSTAVAVFEHKLASGGAGWWIAPINGLQPTREALQVFGEALLTVPFGLALGGAPRRLRWSAAAVLGIALGVVIEVGQLFLLSATSQGASVLSRGVGFAVGAWLAPRVGTLRTTGTAKRMRLIVAAAAVPWLVVVAYLAGWGHGDVVVAGWFERAANLHYLPFYYHYYTSESSALTSLLQCVASYAWVGIAVGLLWARPRPRFAALLAGLTAMLFEASELVLVGRHPDPTNVLIAAAAAWVAHLVFHKLRGHGAAVEPLAAPSARPASSARAVAVEAEPGASVAGPWPWISAALIVAVNHAAPGHPAAMVLALVIYVYCVWKEPHSALLLVPAAIALTDEATYTGPRWFDTLDLLMLATAVLAFVHPHARRLGKAARTWPLSAWLLLGLIPGTLIGLGGFDAVDPNALLTPLGSAFGAMQAKGLLWAFVLALFVKRVNLDAGPAALMLGRGMVTALAGVVFLTVSERLAFVGPFDFTSDYRAPGPFSAIALGGAYIECFLAAAVPFAVVAAMQETHWVVRRGSALLVLAAAYATMVTYSRGGQVVFLFAVGASVVLLATRHATHAGPSRRFPPWAKAGLLAIAVTIIAGRILDAPYASERFQQLSADARTRLNHWKESLTFGRQDMTTLLFGNGLGSFGRVSYIQGEPKARPGVFDLHRETGNTWLRSHQGSLSYLDQRVRAAYGEPLTVRARLRATEGSGVQALLCEKDLVQSRQCGVASLRTPADGQWHSVSAPITLPFNPQARWPPRPIRFTLYSGGGGVVDVDDLSVTDAKGHERLRNGDFEAGPAHWLYSSDAHLTWHMKNLWLQVFFELGTVGVAAQVGLLVAGLFGAWRASAAGRPYFMAVAIALLAFQGVGLIDSVIDTPRFAQLYLSLALLGGLFGVRERRVTRGTTPHAT